MSSIILFFCGCVLDYILAYEPYDQDENRRKNRSSKREMFEENLKQLGLELEREDVEVIFFNFTT